MFTSGICDSVTLVGSLKALGSQLDIVCKWIIHCSSFSHSEVRGSKWDKLFSPQEKMSTVLCFSSMDVLVILNDGNVVLSK